MYRTIFYTLNCTLHCTLHSHCTLQYTLYQCQHGLLSWPNPWGTLSILPSKQCYWTLLLYNVLYALLYTVVYTTLTTLLYTVMYSVIYTILYITMYKNVKDVGLFSKQNYPPFLLHNVLNIIMYTLLYTILCTVLDIILYTNITIWIKVAYSVRNASFLPHVYFIEHYTV